MTTTLTVGMKSIQSIKKIGNRNYINSAANDHLVGANLVLNFLYLLTVTFHSKDDAKKNVGSPHC